MRNLRFRQWGGGRKAGGRQERRDAGNSTLEWGRVETGGGCVVG
jgi:hypothetical protein